MRSEINVVMCTNTCPARQAWGKSINIRRSCESHYNVDSALMLCYLSISCVNTDINTNCKYLPAVIIWPTSTAIVLLWAVSLAYALLVLPPPTWPVRAPTVLLCAWLQFLYCGLFITAHDACHGSYSGRKWVNNLLGLTMNALGSNAFLWKIQHNVIHHTYTNVHNHDEDITPPGFMRFEPHADKKWVHKLQFLYAWFFYGMMTLMWTSTKDFKQLNRYNKQGLLAGLKTTYKKELTIIIVSKVLYFLYYWMVQIDESHCCLMCTNDPHGY